jgi:hypothetical protein
MEIIIGQQLELSTEPHVLLSLLYYGKLMETKTEPPPEDLISFRDSVTFLFENAFHLSLPWDEAISRGVLFYHVKTIVLVLKITLPGNRKEFYSLFHLIILHFY